MQKHFPTEVNMETVLEYIKLANTKLCIEAESKIHFYVDFKVFIDYLRKIHPPERPELIKERKDAEDI